MSDIFLSYASRDREKAKALAVALERQGWSVWWDRRIPTGRDYADVIETELAAARCVVVLWSEASVASEWVKTEAADAKDRRLLVPVLIEPVKIPLEFRRVQAADLTDWGGETTHLGFTTLVGDLSGRLGGPDPDEPRPAPDPRGPFARKVVFSGGGVAEADADFSGAPPRERPGGDGRETEPPRHSQGRALLLLGGAAVFLMLISVGLVWSGAAGFLFGGSRNERAENSAGGNVTQSSSPAPLSGGATPVSNSRPSPTPTPAASAAPGGNVNGGGGTKTGDNSSPPPEHLNAIRKVLGALNSSDDAMREKALSVLIAKHASDPAAVGEALNLLEAGRVKGLSLDGIMSVFLYLNKTEDSAWTPELRARATRQLRHLDDVEMDGRGLTQYGIHKQHLKSL